MLKLKISSITSTLALAAISLATLTTSGGNHLDSFLFETDKAAIYEPYIGNANSSELSMDSLNSSLFSYTDRKSTRLNSSHPSRYRMPSSA